MTMMKKSIIVVMLVLALGCLLTGCGESFGSLSEAVEYDMTNEDLTIDQQNTLMYISDELEANYSDVENKYLVKAYLSFREHVVDGTWDDVDFRSYTYSVNDEVVCHINIDTHKGILQTALEKVF